MSSNKDIQGSLKRYKVKEVIFSLAVFLLPINLFKVWRPSWAYLDGIFVDYWAPSLHASTIAIWLLWLLFFWELYLKRSKQISWGKLQASVMAHFRLFFKSREYLVVVTLLIILLFGRPLLSSSPYPAWYFLLETFSGPVLLLLYLWIDRTFSTTRLRKALLIAIIFQSFLSIYQLFLQKPLAPYWILGEPRFASASFLATSQLSTTVRALPYGSTPHPNVLASWMLIGILACISGKIERRHFILAGVFFFTLLTTESLTALASLPLLLLAYSQREKLRRLVSGWSNTGVKSWLPLTIAALGTTFWQGLILSLSRVTDSPSVDRRAELLLSGLRHWPDWWLSGAGVMGHLNLTKLALISSFQGRFLQPVHSVAMVMAMDLGIGGLLLLFAFSIFGYKSYSLIFWMLLGILPIFSLDHFGVTTISGQFIIILLPLFFSNYFPETKPLKK